MKLAGWGNHARHECDVRQYSSRESLAKLISTSSSIIARGNGRSYGDSSIGNRVINLRPRNKIIEIDQDAGLVNVQSGVLLSDVLEAVVPLGWFLPVAPGTRRITVGGAIASDVHGKNHHISGCFSEFVREFTLMLPDGATLTCGKENNVELFRATCGGMGLTGIILDACLELQAIGSTRVVESTVVTENLGQLLAEFEKQRSAKYSVAWLDCLAKGDAIGRGVFSAGEFSNDGQLDYQPSAGWRVPFRFPSDTLNRFSVACFNSLYYRRFTRLVGQRTASLDSFFFPLDRLRRWNRLYGRRGFLQYQFVIPEAVGYDGLMRVLNKVVASTCAPVLAVLKLLGPRNENLLSFPMRGFTLAIDFPASSGVFQLLDELDEIVIEYGGRVYLTKDARMSRQMIEQSYPLLGEFRRLRREYRMDECFKSLQSERLGI